VIGSPRWIGWIKATGFSGSVGTIPFVRFLFSVLALQIGFHVAAIGQSLPPAAVARAIHPHATVSSGNTNLAITALNIPVNSLAWDPVSQRIYLSIPSAAGTTGNAIQVLDPATGLLGANVFAGSEPDLLSVSANSKYLYVGLDGASAVQRMTLPGLGLDIKIPLGGPAEDAPYFAGDVQASPAADGTVMVVRNSHNDFGAVGGVAIFDDSTARPITLCGFGGPSFDPGCVGGGAGEFDVTQWNSDGSMVFAGNNETSGYDLYTVTVAASGFGKVIDYPGLAVDFRGTTIHFDRFTKLVYSDYGWVIDPIAGAKVGVFNTTPLEIMVPDGALGTAFFLAPGLFGDQYVLTSYDMQTLAPITTAILTGIVGTPNHLIRWGSSGLAFTTANTSGTGGGTAYILSGTFVAPPSAPQIFTGGVVPVGSPVNTVQSGEWVSIYGVNLASGIASWSGNFPTSLGGSSATIDGKPAYLSYVSPGLINVQVPDDTATGPVSVIVTTAGQTSTSSVTLAEFAPSLPLIDSTHVSAIIVRSDGSGAYGGGTYDIVGPTGTSLGYPTVAAKAGDLVALFALGLGPTNPVVPAGQAFSGAASTTHPVSLKSTASTFQWRFQACRALVCIN
jgi:uncharacterized protein (TIGR03437 family)